MMEGMPKQKTEDDKENSIHFTRHSKSEYKTTVEALKSDNPQQPIDVERQVIPDLSEKGVEMAEEAAEKFFSALDPQKDHLFFASSNEARALETANIYRWEAKKRGFNIFKPEHVRGKLAEEMGDGDIRVIENLSLNIENNLVSSVFNPEAQQGEVNWDAVDEETKQRWAEARKIINSDDKGSWGANFYYHSSEIKKIFPEIADSEEEYNNKFKKLLRLARFGIKKANESNVEGNVKILAFGHESYMLYALEKYFSEEGINNCETVQFEISDSGVQAIFRGRNAEIND